MTKMIKRGDRALILGAGMAGLSAAAAIAPYFAEVIILEKDKIDAHTDVRMGAVQGAHIHTMLRGGEAGLEKLLPGFRDELLRAGAVELDMGADYVGFDGGVKREQRFLDMPVVMMSRPGYERVLRDRICSINNVKLISGARVESLKFLSSAPSVTVVINQISAQWYCDFIIDARGRGSPIPTELKSAGIGEVPQSELGIQMCYVSGRFKRPKSKLDSKTAMLVRPEPPNCHYGIVVPIEGGDWMITLGGRRKTIPPKDLDGFLDYVRALGVPEFDEFIQGAELIGGLARYRKQTSFWRHYDQMANFPAGFMPIGDTTTSINPTFGQGMSLAVFHAAALGQALQQYAPNTQDFRAVFWQEAMAASATAWGLSSTTDLQYGWVSGARPEDFAERVAFSKGVKLLANDDVAVQRLVMEVFHMERPASALSSPEFIQKVIKKQSQS